MRVMVALLLAVAVVAAPPVPPSSTGKTTTAPKEDEGSPWWAVLLICVGGVCGGVIALYLLVTCGTIVAFYMKCVRDTIAEGRRYDTLTAIDSTPQFLCTACDRRVTHKRARTRAESGYPPHSRKSDSKRAKQ